MPILPYNSPDIVRLLSNIDIRGPDECWPWRPTGRSNRYAMIKVRREGKPRLTTGAHRLMWQLFIGPIPKGLEICHKCDDGYCLNPAHHFIGTHLENMQDKIRKGRYARAIPGVRGELHGQSRLTAGQVLEIRSRCDAGEPNASIAADYPCSRSNISLIGRRERWKYLPES